MASQGVTLTVLDQLKVTSCTLRFIFSNAEQYHREPKLEIADQALSGPVQQSSDGLSRFSELPDDLIHCCDALSQVSGMLQGLYGGLYSEGNVAISGTHTHSGPGGYLQYILYIITSLGFVRESFDVLVGGILEVS